ncbi:hypothetical protein [Duganella sp. FT27W]|uniref:hypothetical protein n=1 Tax=Duganella sp. FT27W TaxID=2654636 RepID=UPI00128CC239|nr:hypothetical protein [Duganella sp. FT27W]MPQ56252.1 hypothetical protein [Duganella sp. FT27W]
MNTKQKKARLKKLTNGLAERVKTNAENRISAVLWHDYLVEIANYEVLRRNTPETSQDVW